MSMVLTDILTDACGLSLGIMLAILPVGLALWLLGWWGHRFWVVLLTTVVAGVYGLANAAQYQTPPLVAAVLLALAAGVLALALVRLVAFVGGGVAGMLLVQAVYPSLHQPLVTFLVAGLLCLLLFRPCVMALTSLSGTLLLTYATLMLLNHQGMLNAPVWCEESRSLLNWATGGLTALGFIIQFLLDRYLFNRKARSKTWLGELRGLFSSRNAVPVKVVPVRRAA